MAKYQNKLQKFSDGEKTKDTNHPITWVHDNP